uniref:multicopper oxidase family protein n=1 Tax=Pararhizobium sp. IMCC3301 TaxID=3067904 RepID=UPI0027404A27|nr:multicopper oxidase family protein [Pararhizobium sp. IMCC3301]
MTINRRQFLKTSAGGAAFAALPISFHAAFAADGFLEITAAPSQQSLYSDTAPASDLWTYNGTAPGPEIRVKRGDRVKVRLINRLDEPTSIHWHGIRIANAMDGVARLTQDAVEPGGSFDYDFIVPDAGTYWYHAHNRSWNQVARGLYGVLIVEADTAEFDAEHDRTLVIDDWRLDQQGKLDTASLGSLMDWTHGGRIGNWLTVNGKSLPRYSLNANEAYRLRLINASNARVLGLDPTQFGGKILAYDGQSLPQPAELTYQPLLLGPAQRVDLLVVPKAGEPIELNEVSGNQPFAFANFDVAEKPDSKLVTPALIPNRLPEPDLAKARSFRLDMTGGAMGQMVDMVYNGKKLEGNDFRDTAQVWAFNGIANLATEPFFSVEREETVVVETINRTSFIHAMHVHGHHFRILERSGSDIDEGQPWRDTFLIGPEQTTKIAFVADNPGKWLLHCHMLEHAAAGMITWFEVG